MSVSQTCPLAITHAPDVFQSRGLLYCMEYLEDNLDDWLGEELEVRRCIIGSTCFAQALPGHHACWLHT